MRKIKCELFSGKYSVSGGNAAGKLQSSNFYCMLILIYIAVIFFDLGSFCNNRSVCGYTGNKPVPISQDKGAVLNEM